MFLLFKEVLLSRSQGYTDGGGEAIAWLGDVTLSPPPPHPVGGMGREVKG